jgi:choline-sulfatase
VIVGDHGEAFGEHGEIYHSILLYRETMDVPLIIIPPEAWRGLPGVDLKGRRVRELVRLQDIAPTLLNALGVREEGFPGQGASLLPLLAGKWEGPRVTYLESLVPYLKYGWCELRGARTDRWTYIRAPEPELYNLASDPAEAKNVYSKHPEIAKRLEAWCAHLAGNEVDLKPQQLDEETIEKLRSLGYVGTVGPVGSPVNNKDPKKLMGVFQLTLNARTALDSHSPADARRILEDALRQDPGNPEAIRLLGSALVQLGQPAEAVKQYQALRQRYPEALQFEVDEAYAHLLAGEIDLGARLLREVLDKEPANSQALDLYPRALARSGRADEARAYLRDRTGTAPNKAAALVTLAQFEWEQNRHKEAAQAAEQAVALDPKTPGAETIVGLWWLEQALRKAAPDGSGVDEAALSRAQEALRRALELTPSDPQAGSRLAWILHHGKKDQEALTLLISVAAGNPSNPSSQVEAGQALHQLGRVREAIPYYERAMGMGYMNPGFLTNFGLAYAATGNRARARELLQRALGMNPDPALAQTIQRNLAGLTQGP